MAHNLQGRNLRILATLCSIIIDPCVPEYLTCKFQNSWVHLGLAPGYSRFRKYREITVLARCSQSRYRGYRFPVLPVLGNNLPNVAWVV